MEKNNQKEQKNTKLMVNFSSKLVTSTQFHSGTSEYAELLRRGYVEVGEIKKDSGRVFLADKFFNPEDKYLNPPTNVDTMSL